MTDAPSPEATQELVGDTLDVLRKILRVPTEADKVAMAQKHEQAWAAGIDEELAAEQRRAADALRAAWAAKEPDELEIGEHITEGEPPDLAVDTDDLPPQRVRLLRYRAWLASLRDDLARMQQGRADFMEQLGAPAVTEAELRETMEGDKRGLLAWMLGGGRSAGTQMPTVRIYERQQLQARLAGETELAEIAKSSLDAIETQIDLRTREIAEVERREHEFLHDALLEIGGAAHVEPYKAQIAAMRGTVRSLLGLDAVVRGRRGFSWGAWPHTANVALPAFGLPGLPGHHGETVDLRAPSRPEIVIAEQEVTEAARPWRALEALLRQNPYVSPAEAAALIAPGVQTAQTIQHEQESR